MAISRILAPVDFSPASRKAFEAAIHLASACGAKIEIVHAIEVLTYRGVAYREILESDTYDDEREQVAQDLEEWADIARQRGVEVSCKVLEGDARGAIIEHASTSGADLIVLGAKGHSRLRDILVGSVANSVMQKAPCSVYLVR